MSVPCASCGAQNEAEARFCVRCGSALGRRCATCGADIPAGARFCPSCGRPVAAEAAPEERKVATAVFVDLAESTALGERFDPERVRAILQDYFALVAATTAAWGGSIEKYIGDAAVALFGVPRVREDDAARAVSAAAEIVARFTDLARDIEARHGAALAIRVGVNTGEVVAPSEIHPDRPMVTGDAINVAARLQTAAAPNQVLVGDRAFQATRSLFRFGDPVALSLKGKAAHVTAHPLVGAIQGAIEAGPERDIRAGVVGRERELAVLAGLLDDAIETGSPRLAVVYGPAGIGKSRLVREAVTAEASGRPDLLLLRGRCPAAGNGITFWPLAEIVRSACAISLDSSASAAQQRLRAGIADLVAPAGLPDADREAIQFALATTAGISMPGNPLDRARPVAVVTELNRRWPQFFAALTTRHPVVVVIEDLHWASEQVVEILERVLARATGPILLIATARPEFAETHPTFAVSGGNATVIALRPLTMHQSRSLLAGLLPAHDLPAAMQDRILQTAEGNPLFVEEIVHRLIEAGTVARSDGHWSSSGDAAELIIPDTIHGLLAARIDALPDSERRVLREAAVVGRIFWDEPVAVAVGSSEVGGPMVALERRGLVSMRPTSSIAGQVEYAFKHALIRDVAYAGLSIARRARAHAAVGEWLAGISPDRPDELAELVASHYVAALGEGSDLAWPAGSGELDEVRARARNAFLVGGVVARRRSSTERAIDLHGRAIELATDDAERAGALEELGDDHDAAYDNDRAMAPWDQAIALYRTLPDGDEAVARVAMKIARIGAVRWGGFSVPMDPAVIDEYVDLGLSVKGDEATRAWLLAIRAAAGLRWVAFHRPDPVPLEDRVQAAEEGLASARRTGDASLESTALRAIGALLLAYGEMDRALDLTHQLLEQVDRVGDPRERHLAVIEGTQTAMWTGGEAVAVLPMLREAIVVGRELRVHDLCHSTATLMSALYLQGAWDEVLVYLDEHIRTFKTDSAGTTCPFALGAFQVGALVFAHRGETDRAREVAGLMPKSESPIGVVEGFQALLANALGDPKTGRSIAEHVLSTGARNFAEEPPVELAALLDALIAQEDWMELGKALPGLRGRARELALAGPAADRAEGLMLAAAGDDDGGQALLERAVDAFDKLSPFEAARTREMLADLDASRRSDLFAEALATFERLGATPHADRVRSMQTADSTA